MKLTRAQAEQQGYTVDTTCYPWVAYKGPRFAPTEDRRVLTDLEVSEAQQERARCVAILERLAETCERHAHEERLAHRTKDADRLNERASAYRIAIVALTTEEPRDA